jgi:hypothetical protein
MSSTILLCDHHKTIKKVLNEELNVIAENNPDLYQINVENESVKIKQIREIGEGIIYPPSKSKYKTFIIYSFEKTTIPAQNAFLKSLEEHPEYIQFILQCNTLNGVLDTIQSRCVIKKIKNHSNDDQTHDKKLSESLEKMWQILSTGSYADIIDFLTEYKNRENAIQFVNDFIIYLHKENSHQPNKNKIIAIQSLLTCLSQLEQNSNVLLTLENHLFSIKSRF